MLKIIIAILRDSTFGDKCLAKVDIEMERLLELQRMQPNEGNIILPSMGDTLMIP